MNHTADKTNAEANESNNDEDQNDRICDNAVSKILNPANGSRHEGSNSRNDSRDGRSRSRPAKPPF